MSTIKDEKELYQDLKNISNIYYESFVNKIVLFLGADRKDALRSGGLPEEQGRLL